jgi:uncharacterized protein
MDFRPKSPMNAEFASKVLSTLHSYVYKENNHVFVANSWIEGGGKGLFAAQKIPEGYVIAPYVGCSKRTVEAMRTKDKSYLMRLGSQIYIDARQSSLCIARHINDCRNPAGYNVRFLKSPEEKCAWVISTRDIFPGEEVFVDYGKWYWASISGTRLSFGQLHRLRSTCTCTSAS